MVGVYAPAVPAEVVDLESVFYLSFVVDEGEAVREDHPHLPVFFATVTECPIAAGMKRCRPVPAFGIRVNSDLEHEAVDVGQAVPRHIEILGVEADAS